MNSFGIVVYSVLFALNQFYKVFLWPLHIIEKTNTPSLEAEHLTSFYIEPEILPFDNVSQTPSGNQFKIFVAIAIITSLIHIIKAVLKAEFTSGDEFIINRARVHSITEQGSENFMTSMDDISWYYPATTIGFNGSSLRNKTILDKPSDLLIWDSKLFNPI